MLFVSVLVYSRLFVYSYPVYRIVHLLSSIYFIYYLLCVLFIFVAVYVSYIYMLTSPVMGFYACW